MFLMCFFPLSFLNLNFYLNFHLNFVLIKSYLYECFLLCFTLFSIFHFPFSIFHFLFSIFCFLFSMFYFLVFDLLIFIF
ncbi:uncharacterized protein ASCRUDRAFT_132224 [Ascoidea rubescens DSM 1968]|uniref:Uncharacterized protein n=1 Tax=Ascoidea rubescens DSM 1968 TaxID=1344418 RepID=A0A1D2V896_9ASCO|nr:hypothetical protein ASCRUDRAFT_132224 [Ascoidea rubescens DSM 1968]ODV57852.1 hypothetical protein ASCRUDRAFT_132224 [Ascoidea rubescens DSM 1968]